MCIFCCSEVSIIFAPGIILALFCTWRCHKIQKLQAVDKKRKDETDKAIPIQELRESLQLTKANPTNTLPPLLKNRIQQELIVSLSTRNVELGCRVCRGSDWTMGEQDGGRGNSGTLIAFRCRADAPPLINSQAYDVRATRQLNRLPKNSDWGLIKWDSNTNKKMESTAFVYPFSHLSLVGFSDGSEPVVQTNRKA